MKKAFTFVELIISIIVIAIASATLPLMLSTANNLEKSYINQDVFLKSATVLTDILSKAWDDDSDANETERNRSLMWVTKNADSTIRSIELNNTNTRYRVGSIKENNFRYFYTNLVSEAKAIPNTFIVLTNSLQKNNISDYNNNHISETLTDGANVECNISVGYVTDKVVEHSSTAQKATWNLHSGVTYSAATDSTNLKRIKVKTLRNIGGETMSVEFVYFSSNIGSPGLKVK